MGMKEEVIITFVEVVVFYCKNLAGVHKPNVNKRIAAAVATIAVEIAANIAATSSQPQIPSTSQSVPLTDTERISILEAQVSSLVDKLVQMSDVITMLSKHNKGLDNVVAE